MGLKKRKATQKNNLMTKRKPEETEEGSYPKKVKSGTTVVDKVMLAIRHEKNYLGSSRQSIVKLLKELFQYENDKAVKKALKTGVEKGVLVCENKTRFKVAGDAEYEMPPTERVDIHTIYEGDTKGAQVENGDMVEISYIGSLVFDDGKFKEFERGSKFLFQVGAGDVIKGMDRGVLGARLKEVRNVLIPSKLAYGKKGSGPDVPPDSDLKFEITMKRISNVA